MGYVDCCQSGEEVLKGSGQFLKLRGPEVFGIFGSTVTAHGVNLVGIHLLDSYVCSCKAVLRLQLRLS